MNEKEQFEQIVRKSKSTIYSVCFMFSNDRDEVDDLFQETLINMWKGFDAFREESKVETWVWRVALNTCISADRKKKRRGQRVPLSMNIDLYQDTDAETLQVQALRNRIGRLGLADRALILLWLENMSYEEIGSILGITAQNVGVKLFRIKEQLKKM